MSDQGRLRPRPIRALPLNAIEKLERLGAGGAAEIWSVRLSTEGLLTIGLDTDCQLVFKAYRPDLFHSRTLCGTFAMGLALSDDVRLQDERHLALACAYVLDPEGPGVLLRRFEGDASQLKAWNGRERESMERPRELVHDLLLPAARCLARFHTAGYCHRDVTPKNLLVTTSAEGAIINFAWADFDLVGRLPERSDDPFSTRALAERLGRPPGTTNYQSERLLRMREWPIPIEMIQDNYAFGLILAELAFGVDVRRARFRDRHTLRCLADDIGLPGLDIVVIRATDQRAGYATMAELADDLSLVWGGERAAVAAKGENRWALLLCDPKVQAEDAHEGLLALAKIFVLALLLGLSCLLLRSAPLRDLFGYSTLP